MDQTPLLSQNLQRTHGQPEHHVCYCILPAEVSPWAPLAPSVPSMSLGGSGSFPASSIFLQAEVGRGELEGAGLRDTSKFSAPQIIRCKGGRKKSHGGWVGDSVAVGRLSHLDGCLLLPACQEPSSALPPPAVAGRCSGGAGVEPPVCPGCGASDSRSRLLLANRSGPGSSGRGAPLLHCAPQLTLGFLH